MRHMTEIFRTLVQIKRAQIKRAQIKRAQIKRAQIKRAQIKRAQIKRAQIKRTTRILFAAFLSGGILAVAATAPGSLTFSNLPLPIPAGASEPAIAIGRDGTVAISGLQWFPAGSPFGTALWTGLSGTTPVFRGTIDSDLQMAGKQVVGGLDADIDIGSTGALHAATLIGSFNPTFNSLQLGVSAIRCPSLSTLDGCVKQILDPNITDRPWITSSGSQVYISYRTGNSQIRVWRSDDDGFTWQQAGDPVTGQGPDTAGALRNSIAGPIVADPSRGYVYQIYAVGENGDAKIFFQFNKIFVARSFDRGKHWDVSLVYSAPPSTSLVNIVPFLSVDPVTGKVYAVWSDGTKISFSASADQGMSWSPAVAVNISPAATAIFPVVAAYNGTVDVAYYGTFSGNEATAVWNVYMAQTTNDGAGFQQSRVSNSPNHHGAVCLRGGACNATRDLLDLFEIAIDPLTGRLIVAYADDTLTKTPAGKPEPQIVLARQ
jgi:hypothetical protein